MGRVFQPKFTRPDGNGGRETVQVSAWYVEWTDGAGKQRRKKIGTKRAAESALARFQEDAARARHGLPDPAGAAAARNRPLADRFAEHLTELRNRGRAPAYVKEVDRHLTAGAAACRWHSWADVSEPAFTKFLAAKRAGKSGVSPATANGYVRSMKGFAARVADALGELSPLRNVKLFNEQVDRRRSRRVLDGDEFAQLVAATEAAPRRHNALFTGRERAALYRVAAYTGLRLSELASLTPSHFALDAEIPVVTVRAEDTKGKREEPVPLEPSLVAFLREWFQGKRADRPLWPGTWARDRRHVRWVQNDATRAELGKGVTFHSLRRKYVSDLIKTGADIDEVRRLARHRSATTTLNHYAETRLTQLAKVVGKLKPLG